MQKSTSILSFESNTEYTKLLHQPKPQRRSSLDTLVIPGRVRLPSSKTSHSSQGSIEIQIAQTLLNKCVMSRPHSSDFGAWSSLQQQSPSSRSGSGRYTIAPQGTTRQVRRTSYQQTIEPGRIRRTETHRVSPRLSTTDTTDDPFLDQTDGPSDGAGLRHTSRMASSSLSNLGSRVTSDSSASSWASTAIKFKNDYNVLAQQHGLPPFPDQISGMPDQMGVSLIGSNDLPEQDGTPSQTQVTQKVHRHWLSRKFLPRSSSTFTLKAKTAFKPLSRKKSLGGFLARGESASTNVLKDRSLEEVCRLGGTIPLILPPEFALNELFLPASLTTLANYILQQSTSSFTSPHSSPITVLILEQAKAFWRLAFFVKMARRQQ